MKKFIRMLVQQFRMDCRDYFTVAAFRSFVGKTGRSVCSRKFAPVVPVLCNITAGNGSHAICRVGDSILYTASASPPSVHMLTDFCRKRKRWMIPDSKIFR